MSDTNVTIRPIRGRAEMSRRLPLPVVHETRLGTAGGTVVFRPRKDCIIVAILAEWSAERMTALRGGKLLGLVPAKLPILLTSFEWLNIATRAPAVIVKWAR